MMFTVAFVALIRLVPYAFVAVNAWTKGYRWLTVAGLYLIAIALFNYFVPTNADVRAFLAAVSAFLLMMHALDLKPKNTPRR